MLLGSFAGPPVSAATGGVSAVFGIMSYLSTARGQPILGEEILTKASDLRRELFDRFDLASQELTAVGLLIVSDWGKLMDAEQHIKSNWTLENMKPVEDVLRTASTQHFYESLVPVAYPYLIQGTPDGPAGQYNSRDAHSFLCFAGQPDNAQVSATAGYNGSGQPIKNRFFFTRGWGLTASPPAKLADDIFRTTTGLEKLSFFTPRIFGKVYQATNGVNACGVGYLPFWKP
jgi:hypothetical protein